LALVEQGYEVPFGYEEAIGFMIGSEIRDKDGVAAAVQSCSVYFSGEGADNFQVFFAELVALLHREGKTASGFLQELYDRCVSICTKVPVTSAKHTRYQIWLL
jgi:phosphomannomutase